MSIESYNRAQERILRHKIGDELYEVLAFLLDNFNTETLKEIQKQLKIRGQNGMETVRPGPSKMELSSIQKNGIRTEACAENAKPRTGNNTLPYTY